MSGLQRGLVLGGLQLALLMSMAGKYAVDRETLPRVWVRVTPFDPTLPLRGRYVRLQAHAILRGAEPSKVVLYGNAALSVENGQLVATTTDMDTGVKISRDADDTAVLTDSIAYFIPEHVADPSRRAAGEELWAEVSVPKKGPPRPLRLGVKKAGKITPLDLD